MEIKVIDNDGIRLDKYLMDKLDVSRSKIRKLVDNGNVLINGVKSKAGILKINSYGRVMSKEVLKYALILNGPCFGALPVYSDRDKFWEKWAGDTFCGYHAIALVGYNEEGFIIRNSWGRKFGDNGYVTIPYEDFDELIEIWTVID